MVQPPPAMPNPMPAPVPGHAQPSQPHHHHHHHPHAHTHLHTHFHHHQSMPHPAGPPYHMHGYATHTHMHPVPPHLHHHFHHHHHHFHHVHQHVQQHAQMHLHQQAATNRPGPAAPPARPQQPVLTMDSMPVGLLHSLQKTVALPYMPINPSHIPPIPPPAGPADPKDMSDALRAAVGSFYRSIRPNYGTEAVLLQDFEPAVQAAASPADGPREQMNTGWHDKSAAEWDEERERRRERRRRMRKEEELEEDPEEGRRRSEDTEPAGGPQGTEAAPDPNDPFEEFRRNKSLKTRVRLPVPTGEATGCYRCGAMGHFKRDCTAII
eukprot:GGOE01014725.1.p1 GENE.GGOE01014725.1~~GGOE01014725.1.p1  ORF type:complete len:355 (+),score=65.66 GGOE01014725.1:97-1065(+)